MANNIINGVTTENTPKFTNEDIEKIREKLKENNSNNLGADGKMINDSGVQVITLKDCVNIVNGFIEGKVSADELEEFGNRMTIRSYIPLLEKMSILMQILIKHNVSAVESVEIKMAELYKDIFFTIVLGSYGLIRIDAFDVESNSLMTYENYDKLFPIFNQYILTYCKDDYKVFISMLKDCINFNGIMDIVDALSNIDSDKIAENVQINKELIENLGKNKELIKDMKDIILATDGNVTKIAQGIKQVTLDEINSKTSNSENLKVRDVIEKTKIELENKKVQTMISSDSQPKKKRGRPKKGTVVNVDFGKEKEKEDKK